MSKMRNVLASFIQEVQDRETTLEALDKAEGQQYTTADNCEQCNPDKEELVDKEAEQALQEFYENNPFDLEQEVENNIKRNRENHMKNLLETLVFTKDSVDVTYNHEEGSYTFKTEAILPTSTDVGEFTPKKLKDETVEKVKHPSHYNQTPVETMEKFFLLTNGNDDMVKGALLFNIVKYTDRAGHKDDIETENGKISFYLDLLNHLYPTDYENYRRYQEFKKNKK